MLRASGVMSLKTLQKSSTVLEGRHLGAGAFPPEFFSRRIFLKSNRKRAFWGDFADIAIVKPKHLPPLEEKMSIAVIVKRRFYMIFRCFAMEDYVKKGENFKFCGHGRREPRAPGANIPPKVHFPFSPENFLTFFRNKS